MNVNNTAQGMLKQDFSHVGSDKGMDNMQGFGDKAIRRGFIRKVYGILMCQLVLTGALISCLMFIEPVKMYCYRNIWTFYTSLGVTLVCIITLACCESVRRKSPMNFIILGIFTFCEGFLLGVIASRYDVSYLIFFLFLIMLKEGCYLGSYSVHIYI